MPLPELPTSVGFDAVPPYVHPEMLTLGEMAAFAMVNSALAVPP